MVDDDDLPPGARREGGTIGVQSAPYGQTRVELFDGDGEVAGSVEVADRNHAWLTGLEPDTEYRYRITVDGEPMGGRGAPGLGLARRRPPGRTTSRAGRTYDMRLRTHPAGDKPVPTTFLAIGDFGVGIERARAAAARRRWPAPSSTWPPAFRSASSSAWATTSTTAPTAPRTSRGDEDDDWYFPFFQPYRYLIDHLPLYPAAGNHDGSDEEASDDRQQLADNFHLEERFGERQERGRASLHPGSSTGSSSGRCWSWCASTPPGARRKACTSSTTTGTGSGSKRRFPDEGEPVGGGQPAGASRSATTRAHCAGPHHETMQQQVDSLLPLYHRAGVRMLLSGHEHNFQHGRVDGLDYIVSGAGGQARGA